jgi:hypothetical protein
VQVYATYVHFNAGGAAVWGRNVDFAMLWTAYRS